MDGGGEGAVGGVMADAVAARVVLEACDVAAGAGALVATTFSWVGRASVKPAVSAARAFEALDFSR